MVAWSLVPLTSFAKNYVFFLIPNKFPPSKNRIKWHILVQLKSFSSHNKSIHLKSFAPLCQSLPYLQYSHKTVWAIFCCWVLVFLLSNWGSTAATAFNQLYFRALVSNFTVFVPLLPLIRYPARLVPNYVSQLNSPLKCSCSSVTPEKKWSPDKSWSDIAVLIFASIQALLEPTVSFCRATIKITGQWNILPKGRV